MPLLQLAITDLPTAPLDAAAEFFATKLPDIRDDADVLPDHDLVIVFAPAGYEHRGWRLAAIQELACELAPRRVNGVVGDDENAIMEAVRFLDAAPGISGQLLAVDGKSGERG